MRMIIALSFVTDFKAAVFRAFFAIRTLGLVLSIIHGCTKALPGID